MPTVRVPGAPETDREALARVQAMLQGGASAESVQSWLQGFLTPTAQALPPPAPMSTASHVAAVKPRAEGAALILDTRLLAEGSKRAPSPERQSPPLQATAQLPGILGAGSSTTVVVPPLSGMHRGSTASGSGTLPSVLGGVQNSSSLSALSPASSPARMPMSLVQSDGSPYFSSASSPAKCPRSTSFVSSSRLGAVLSTVRPESRKDINAYLDGTFARAPVTRPLVPPSPAASATSFTVAPTSRTKGALCLSPSTPTRLEVAPSANTSSSASQGSPIIPPRVEVLATDPRPASVDELGELSTPKTRRETLRQLPSSRSPRGSFSGASPTQVNSSTSPVASSASCGSRATSLEAAPACESPTYRAANSSLSNAVWANGRRPGRERRVPMADSLAEAYAYSTGSRQDFLTADGAGAPSAGPLNLSYAPPPARRRNSTLQITGVASGLSLDTGDDDEDASGGASRRRGPQFARLVARDTPAHVPLKETRRMLAELDIPYVAELHVEGVGADGETDSEPPSGIAAEEVNVNELTVRYGTICYVYITMNAILRYSFVGRFGFDKQRLLNFVKTAFSFFRVGNPLHHPIHAADIVIAAHQWLSQPTVAENLSDEEMLAFLFAAIVMRVGHSGVDNRLLTLMKHPYAMMCSYSSPQQGATVALVLALMEKPENRFFPYIFHTKEAEEDERSMLTSTTLFSREDIHVGVSEHPPAAHAAPQPRGVKHEWTQSRERQFYDLLSELVLSTDERNHFVLQSGVERVREDHFRAHGCLCALRGHPNGVSGGGTFACRNCCAYLSDAYLPSVLKAVLHFIDFAYLFRPFEVFLAGCFVYTAEMYRQLECQSHLLYSIDCIQRAALLQQRRRAKEATRQQQQQQHPQQLPLAPATSADTAVAPTVDGDKGEQPPAAADVEDATPRAQQVEGRHQLIRSLCLTGEAGGARGSVVSAPLGLVQLANAEDGTAGTSDGGEGPADAFTVEETAEAASARVEAAYLDEQPTWRADALHTTALQTVRTFQDMPAAMQENLVQRQFYRANTERTRQSGGGSGGGTESAATHGAPAVENSVGASAKFMRHNRLPASDRPSMSLPASDGTEDASTRQRDSAAAADTPSLASTVAAEHADAPSSSSRGTSVSGTAAPRRPLQGCGRDIFVVSADELYFPFLAELRPYIPHHWAVTGQRNHERFLTEMPNAEEFDLIVERIIYSAAASRAEAPWLPSVAELQAAVPLANFVPFALITEHVVVQPHWHFDADGLEGRVLKEISLPGREWLAFSALMKGRMASRFLSSTGAAAAASPLARVEQHADINANREGGVHA